MIFLIVQNISVPSMYSMYKGKFTSYAESFKDKNYVGKNRSRLYVLLVERRFSLK